MSNPIVHPILIPHLTNYHEYSARAETDTFHGRYAAVLRPYHIKMVNVDSAFGPQEFSWTMYTTVQEGVPTAFIQWHWGAGDKGAHIALLHYGSKYVPRMGMPPLKLDDLSFTSTVEVTCGATRCVNWLTTSLH